MRKDNQTSDEYQGGNGGREETRLILMRLFTDQNWISEYSRWIHICVSYDFTDQDIVDELYRGFRKRFRPDRDTRNFGYDSCGEGVED